MTVLEIICSLGITILVGIILFKSIKQLFYKSI